MLAFQKNHSTPDPVIHRQPVDSINDDVLYTVSVRARFADAPRATDRRRYPLTVKPNPKSLILSNGR